MGVSTNTGRENLAVFVCRIAGAAALTRRKCAAKMTTTTGFNYVAIVALDI